MINQHLGPAKTPQAGGEIGEFLQVNFAASDDHVIQRTLPIIVNYRKYDPP